MKITTPVLDLKEITPKADTDKEAKLKKACNDFEAIFLKQMLTTMRKSVPKSGLFNDGFANDMYQSMADDQLARDLAHDSSMGIGDILYRQISGQIKSQL
jgi:flagellar protein FlgJ